MAIYKRDIVDINLETGNIHRSFLNHSIGYLDNAADHFGVRTFRNGTPVDLTGVSVQGIFMPPTGSPIAITSGNIVSGNVAEVVLPQACYNYEGQFTLSIKLVGGGVTGTMRIVDGIVDNTHASGTVAPTSAVPTYQEILSTYDDMVAAAAAANGAIAATYSSSSTYAAGDYCIHDGGLYRCKVPITSGETWTAAHWTAAKIGPDVSTIRNALNEESDYVASIQRKIGIAYSAAKDIKHTSAITADDGHSLHVKIKAGSLVAISVTDQSNTGVSFTTYAKFTSSNEYESIGRPVTAGGSAAYFSPEQDVEAIAFYKNELTAGTLSVSVNVSSPDGLIDKADVFGNKQITVANLSGIDSNILFMSRSVTVESYYEYAYRSLVNYTGSISAGDVFSILYDNASGFVDDPPVAFFVYNGTTEIRRSYDYQLEITASDITSGADKVEVSLYPSRGTVLPTGKAVFDNVIVVKGYAERPAFGDDLEKAFLNKYEESNILEHKKRIAVRGTEAYVQYAFCKYTGAFHVGDVFSFIADDPTGASDEKPFAIIIYHNGTEIRREYNQNNRKDLIITADDITAGVDELIFYLYPAKGTALSTGEAVYTNVYAVKGSGIKRALKGELRNATEGTITESNVLFSADSYTLRGDTNYITRAIYDEKLPLISGDLFSLLYDSVTGETALYPQGFYVFNNNTEIRRTYFPKLEITEEDIAAGANRIVCEFYPAQGTALPTGIATYTNVRLVRGIIDGVGFANKSKIAAGGIVNTNGDIPAYYFTNDYLQEKVKTIKAIEAQCAATGDAFIFITDGHLKYNAGHSPALLNYIGINCMIPRLFNGGDLADHGSQALADAYRSRYPYKIYTACGNHEWMQPTDGDELFMMFDMFGEDQIGNPFEHYYYVDNRQKKIRYVVLNAFLRNSDHSVFAAMSGYNQQQLDWFTGEALDLPDNSWDVIVITHFIGPFDASSFVGYQDFLNAMDTFNSGSSAGKILFVMAGHTHYDAVWHTTGGIPIISTTCDKNAPWYQGGVNREEYLSEYRPSGTIYEQAFDVVLVDRVNRKVKAVRIGCPAYDNIDIGPSSQSFSYVPELEIRTVDI